MVKQLRRNSQMLLSMDLFSGDGALTSSLLLMAVLRGLTEKLMVMSLY